MLKVYSEMNTDEGLAIGIIVITFGLGLICMVTIFCRSYCAEDQEVAQQQEGGYTLIDQENPQLQ